MHVGDLPYILPTSQRSLHHLNPHHLNPKLMLIITVSAGSDPELLESLAPCFGSTQFYPFVLLLPMRVRVITRVRGRPIFLFFTSPTFRLSLE